MFRITSLCVLASFGILSSLAEATPQLTIVPNSLRTSGPGCPAGSVHESIVNNKTIEFVFDELMAFVGLGLPSLLDQKNCVATVDVQVPAGYRVAPGPVQLEATVNSVSESGSATAYARYYIGGKASHFASSTVTSDQFPADGSSYDMRIQSADASVNPDAWSGACGGTYTLNLQARAIARRGQNDVGNTEIFIDRAVNGMQHKVQCHLQLKPCGAP